MSKLFEVFFDWNEFKMVVRWQRRQKRKLRRIHRRQEIRNLRAIRKSYNQVGGKDKAPC